MARFRTEGPVGLWRYFHLSAVATLGMLDGSLEEATIELSAIPRIEIAPIKKDRGQDSLAAVIAEDPFRDISLTQDGVNRSEIVIYSLRESKAKETMEELLQQIPFYPDAKLDKFFVQAFEKEFQIEINAYEWCNILAQKAEEPLEQTFAAVRYATYLHRYNSRSQDDAIHISRRKFGLRLG